jgi:hypothetical protein
MGYETKMYIGTPYCGGKEPYIQIEGHQSAYRVYNDKDKKGDYFYLKDGNTKRYISGLKRQGVGYKIVEVETMQVVAMVDLCKASVGAVEEVINKGHSKEGERGGFYDDGGNAIIIEDRYCDAMTFVDPKEVLRAMQESQKKEPYRRFTIAISTLKAAIKGFKTEKLKVLFFGY